MEVQHVCDILALCRDLLNIAVTLQHLRQNKSARQYLHARIKSILLNSFRKDHGPLNYVYTNNLNTKEDEFYHLLMKSRIRRKVFL